MTLILTGTYATDQLDSLINQLEDELIRNVDIKQIIRFQNYNDKYKLFVDNYGKPINILNALYIGISHIQYYITNNNHVIIRVDENFVYPDTNIKLIDICKFINNGNIQIQAYPLFSKIFGNYQRINRQGLI